MPKGEPWTAAEDNILRLLRTRDDPLSYHDIARDYLPARTAKGCRYRWEFLGKKENRNIAGRARDGLIPADVAPIPPDLSHARAVRRASERLGDACEAYWHRRGVEHVDMRRAA